MWATSSGYFMFTVYQTWPGTNQQQLRLFALVWYSYKYKVSTGWWIDHYCQALSRNSPPWLATIYIYLPIHIQWCLVFFSAFPKNSNWICERMGARSGWAVEGVVAMSS